MESSNGSFIVMYILNSIARVLTTIRLMDVGHEKYLQHC